MRTKFIGCFMWITILIFGIAFIHSAVAQITEDPPVHEFDNPDQSEDQKVGGSGKTEDRKASGSVHSFLSDREFWLSTVILIFGVFIIVIEYFLLRTVVKNKTEEIARTYTVTLIIIGTLVLISSGLTSEQIAPALGLSGTIAGYLLGRSDLKANNAKGGNENESEK